VILGGRALRQLQLDHARVGRLRVAQLPGLVDRLAGQAEVRDGRFNVLLRNVEVPRPAATGHLAPLLCGVVLVREPALGLGLDFEGIGLRLVGSLIRTCYSTASTLLMRPRCSRPARRCCGRDTR
jgi:hypothetical protein